MNARNWELAARNQHVRARRAERQYEDSQHAINLLINGSVEWFLTRKEPDGKEHRFGIGVVKNQPVNDLFDLIGTKGKDTEDRAIVLFLTCHKLENGRVGKYMSTFSIDNFKRFPKELEEEHVEGLDVSFETEAEAKHYLAAYARRLIDGSALLVSHNTTRC